MKKSDIINMPQFFDTYINLAKDEDIITSLEDLAAFNTNFLAALEILGDKTYAEHKWSVKDILQHLIDNERIQAYRALAFARGESKLLPGYDQEPYAHIAMANRRTFESLFEEIKVVRSSTISLFKSFDHKMLSREGICYNVKISVLALGFVIAGHQVHHLNIISERYLPLV
ncbi:MAG TPA: DinB family protein [Cytophagaceae bacterium]|jgi:hypothetical protein